MLLYGILAFCLGISAGTFTGLIPGIHINLVSSLLVLYLVDKPEISLPLVIFVVAMSITHTFLDFIPSIFLGAPSEENFLSILPGHKLLLEGRGQEATSLALIGCLIGIPLTILIAAPFSLSLPIIFSTIKTIIPYILIFVSLYLIFREENFLSSLTIFTLAGLLGFLTFSLPVKGPLMPLLSGLFGLSGLILSIKEPIKFVKQEIIPLKNIEIKKSEIIKTSLIASLCAPLCSFLPGIGSGHASTLGSEIIETNNRTFILLIGAINVIVMSLSFVTAYAIGKTRTGSSAAVLQILKTITLTDISIILFTILISGICAFIIGLKMSKIAAKFINKIDYHRITFGVILIIILANIIFSNALGLMVLFVASFLGIFTILSGSRRINLMAALLIPSIIYYLTH